MLLTILNTQDNSSQQWRGRGKRGGKGVKRGGGKGKEEKENKQGDYLFFIKET